MNNMTQFEFNNFIYNYKFGWLSDTSERKIEVPIMLKEIREIESGKILEIGNVLFYHVPNVMHEIVDKYEKIPGVINNDICELNLNKKYDLIFSISTLEHVGFDSGEEKEPKKVIKAIERIINHLSINGKFIFTIPVGANPDLDNIIKIGEIKLDEKYAMKRMSEDNLWTQIQFSDVFSLKYNDPFRFANGIIIGVIYKGEKKT